MFRRARFSKKTLLTISALIAAPASNAAIQTFEATGHVSFLRDDPTFGPVSGVNFGDLFVLRYSFDDSVSPTGFDPSFANYKGAVKSAHLTIGSLTYNFDMSLPLLANNIGITNDSDSPLGLQDAYSVLLKREEALSGITTGIQLSLSATEDSAPSAFTSTTLPSGLPPLSLLPQTDMRLFSFEPDTGPVSEPRDDLVVAHIESLVAVQPVPLPGPVGLLLTGLVGIAARGRRR